MKLYLEQGGNSNRITSYQTGSVTINAELIQTSVIVSADTIMRDWGLEQAGDLDSAWLEPVIALKPDVILVGTGSHTVFPERSVMLDLYRAGIGIEVMDTAAACRSFNILVDEGRNVVAALLMIEE